MSPPSSQVTSCSLRPATPPLRLTYLTAASRFCSWTPAMAGPRLRVADVILMVPIRIVSAVTPFGGVVGLAAGGGGRDGAAGRNRAAVPAEGRSGRRVRLGAGRGVGGGRAGDRSVGRGRLAGGRVGVRCRAGGGRGRRLAAVGGRGGGVGRGAGRRVVGAGCGRAGGRRR